MIEDNLPDTMGELLHCALDDLEAAEADPHYTVNMQSWHFPTREIWPVRREVCNVCLAGATLRRCGVSWESMIDPSKVSKTVRLKMMALDYLRQGRAFEAFECLYSFNPPAAAPNFKTPEYLADAVTFKSILRAKADEYLKAGI